MIITNTPWHYDCRSLSSVAGSSKVSYPRSQPIANGYGDIGHRFAAKAALLDNGNAPADIL